MNYLSSLKWLRLMHSSALLITGGCSATYSVQELEGIKMSQRSVIPQDLPICLIAFSILAGASYSACNMSNAAARQPFARSRLSVGSHFKLAAPNSVTTRQNQQSVCHQVILNAKKKLHQIAPYNHRNLCDKLPNFRNFLFPYLPKQ